ncbi:MAG: hypothetical protein AB7S77_04830 [Desulfatirhabdiaceae bacterium]
MIRFIHRDPQFEKQLDALRKAGKKGLIAVREAEKIIQRLIHGRRQFFSLNDATKRGELRMSGCIKYDLGTGYRMVTIRRSDMLHISFVGTHDECDRWLESRKRLKPVFLKNRSAPIPIEIDESDFAGEAIEMDALTCEDEPFEPVDEKYLRLIFSGLTGKCSGLPDAGEMACSDENSLCAFK